MSEERDQHIEQLVHRFEKALERLERATATLEPPVPQAERAPQRQQPVTEQGKPVETSPGGGATDKSQPKPHDKQSVAASASRSASRADKPALRRPGKAVKAPVDAWRILRYVGVALLLLGTAFLFNYVQEESRGLMWLRVGTAFAIGLGLITVGLRLRTREPQFSQVLSGGGTGVWFITGFAAYQVFGLIPAPVGLAWMAIVTLICFLFSIRHDAESLALIGTIGGLSTPFLFEASARGPIGVVVFVLYVVGCALAIHVHRGWRPLLWAAVLGSWGALTVCLWQYVLEATTTASVTEKVALQLGVTCLWLAFAVVPVAREAASRANPGRWPRPVWLRDSSDLLVLANLAPLVALFMTGAVWDLDKQPGGLVALGGALAYTIVVLRTRNVPGFPGFRTAHIQAAVMLWTVALCMLLEGDTLRFALATEAAFLLRMRRHSPRLLLAIWGHGLFLVLGWVVLLGLTSALTGKGGMVVGDLPLLNARGLADLYTVVAAAVASMWLTDPQQRLVYRYPAHVLFLLVIGREFNDVVNGAGVVSAIWGLYSVVLIVTGIRRRSTTLRTVGLVTLFVVIGKLILIDMSEVKAIWRVLLFLGFGGGLLALSYYFHKMNLGGERDSGPSSQSVSPGPQ